ncbi:hypothetical protein DRN85_07475, partial [Methanosarcinales archaeon]
MRAFFLGNPKDFPHHTEVKKVPIPDCKGDEILIKVAACAVCGTDVKKYFKGHKLIKSYPVIPGHEFSGKIVKVGKKVKEFEVVTPYGREKRKYEEGQRVVVAPVVACEKCSNCLDGRFEACEKREDIGFNYNGGFAEYVVIPGEILKKKIPPIYFIPDNVSLYEAAIAEPLACAIHAQSKIFRYFGWNKKEKRYNFEAGIKPGDTVVVIGGGPLGCMHAELAKAQGADVVIIAQRSHRKLEIAKKMEVADYYVQNFTSGILRDEVREITKGRMADVVITACSVAEAQKQAFEVVKKGGFVSLFGGVSEKFVEIPTNEIHYNGPLVGGTSGASPYHLEIALNLMSQGKINPTKYITHVLNLESLDKILFIKGIPQPDFPGFSSMEEAATTIRKEKGSYYLDVLNK